MRPLAVLALALSLGGCAVSNDTAFDLGPPRAVCRDGAFSYAPSGDGRCAGHDGVWRAFDDVRRGRRPD
jgi:hypothetical protein